MGFERPKRKWFEQAVVFFLVFIVGFLAVSNIYYQNKSGKQKAMFYQLQILRSAINLYKFINSRNPPDLGVLAGGVYKFPQEELARRYVENAPIDKNGIVVDPFGKPYYYDAETGWIRSLSKGYEFW